MQFHLNTWRPGQDGQHFADNIFKLTFLTKSLYFDPNFTDHCSSGSNYQWGRICSGNGLAPAGCHAITWTNINQDIWHHMASPGHNELNLIPHTFVTKLWMCIIFNSSVPGQNAGIILSMRPPIERRRYNVTSSLIGWAHAQNDPWKWLSFWQMTISNAFL